MVRRPVCIVPVILTSLRSVFPITDNFPDIVASSEVNNPEEEAESVGRAFSSNFNRLDKSSNWDNCPDIVATCNWSCETASVRLTDGLRREAEAVLVCDLIISGTEASIASAGEGREETLTGKDLAL